MSNNDELFKFNLQLFADLDGVEDDDGKPDDDDDNTPDVDEDADLDEILKGLTGDGDGDDDEPPDDKPDPEDDDDPDDKPDDDDDDGKGKPNQEPENIDEIINQRVVAEVNRIIPERLARDRKTQEVAKLEHLTGMNLEQVTQTVINNMVEAKAEELGITEEEARAIVNEKLENAGLKAEKVAEKQQKDEVSAAMVQVNYLKDKTTFMGKPKYSRLVKAYEAEIDAFTQDGKVLDFEGGMNYILGKHLADGDLIKKMQAGAEQKAARTLDKKGKAAPQNKSAGVKSDAGALTKEERQIAANLGVTEKEYAEEKLSETNKKQRRSR